MKCDSTNEHPLIAGDRHVVAQRRHEMKSDKQRKEERRNHTTRCPSLAHDHPDITLEKKLEEISNWLDGLNCAEKQDVTLLLRQEDTCKWLLDTTEYKIWKDGESGSLRLRGKRENIWNSTNHRLLTWL